MPASLKEYRKTCQGKYYKLDDMYQILFLRIIKVDVDDDNIFTEYCENVHYDKSNAIWSTWNQTNKWGHIANPIKYDFKRINKSEFCKARDIAKRYDSKQKQC